MNERKSYTEEFKREAVRLADERGNLSAVARDLGINQSLIHKWKRQMQTDQPVTFPGKGNSHDPELAQLKRDYARLQEENEILKKAVGIFTNRPS